MDNGICFSYKKNRYYLQHKKNQSVPIYIFLKINKECFNNLVLEFNGTIDMNGEVFFYSKNDIIKFINFLKK